MRAWRTSVAVASALSWSCLLPPMDFTPVDGEPCDGDVASNPHHCGRCGHDCLGGACEAGKCQPITIAGGLSSPVGVAVDDTSVYWVTSGIGDSADATTTVGVATKNGTERRTLYTTDTWRSPNGLAVDARHVAYASNRGAIVRVDKRDGTSFLLTRDPLGPRGLALDRVAGSVLWVDELPAVGSVSIAGGPAKVLAQTAGNDLAIDATSIFVAGAALRRIPRAGCPDATDCSVVLMPGPLRHVAVDDVYVVAAEATAGVFQMRKEGGPKVPVTSELADGITLDSEWIYWSTYAANGVVARKRKDSMVTEVLATGQSFPAGLAVDDGAVYWCNRGTGDPLFAQHDGTVMKVAK